LPTQFELKSHRRKETAHFKKGNNGRGSATNSLLFEKKIVSCMKHNNLYSGLVMPSIG
jgi:hypothetical protein